MKGARKGEPPAANAGIRLKGVEACVGIVRGRLREVSIARAGDGDVPGDELDARVARIRELGVPNYFGEQRFGREAGNVGLSIEMLEGRRMKRHERSIAISAGRSYLFNAIVDARVGNSSWDRIVEGELANLDGSGSVFDVDELTEAIERRAAEMDIHPTATLWGRGAPKSGGEAARLELATVGAFDEAAATIAAGVEKASVDAASRATRLVVHDLVVERTAAGVCFAFRLGRGAYATAVLREIVSAP